MNVTRIHSMEFETKKALKKRMKGYRKQAREQFPEAELLMTIRTSPRSILAISAYPDQETADTNFANREKFMHKVKDNWFMEGSVDRLQLNKRIY